MLKIEQQLKMNVEGNCAKIKMQSEEKAAKK